MPSLELLMRKHGEKTGRDLYNTFHRKYRAKRKTGFREYWRKRRAALKSKAKK